MKTWNRIASLIITVVMIVAYAKHQYEDALFFGVLLVAVELEFISNLLEGKYDLKDSNCCDPEGSDKS